MARGAEARALARPPRPQAHHNRSSAATSEPVIRLQNPKEKKKKRERGGYQKGGLFKRRPKSPSFLSFFFLKNRTCYFGLWYRSACGCSLSSACDYLFFFLTNVTRYIYTGSSRQPCCTWDLTTLTLKSTSDYLRQCDPG